MAKIFKILLWIGIPVLVFIIGLVAQNIYKNRTVNSVIIDITSENSKTPSNFISEEDIKTFMRKKENTIEGTAIKNINIEELEKNLMEIPYIKNVDVYTTFNSNVNMRIQQRRAIVRISDMLGNQYYLDDEARILPLRASCPARVPFCNGYIKNINYYSKQYSPAQLDSIVGATSLEKIYQMSKYIDSDSLLKVQIAQLYIDADTEFTLVPVVGNQIIKFGKAENIEEKFEKLKTFYKQGLEHHSWNDYKVLNLKYKDQIVCTKI